MAARSPGPTPGTRSSSSSIAEGAAGLAIGDDGLGKCEADSWKASQLGGRRAVGVDPLVGAERPFEREDAVAMRAGRSGGRVARSWTSPGGWPGRVASHLTPWPANPNDNNSNSARRSAEDMTEDTGGARTPAAGSSDPARRRRGLLFFLTSPTATSPTIWRLADETLSMVSSGGVPGGIVEVHHVDRADAHLLQLEVVVDQRVLGRGDEVARVAQLARGVPYPLHDLGRAHQRIAFLIDLQILVGDQVPEHRVQRLRARHLVGGVVPGPDEYVQATGLASKSP